MSALKNEGQLVLRRSDEFSQRDLNIDTFLTYINPITRILILMLQQMTVYKHVLTLTSQTPD